MSDLSYSAMLRDLSRDYYQNHIGYEDYRTRRKALLDKIDIEFNGFRQSESESAGNDESILMKTIAFFKNNDA